MNWFKHETDSICTDNVFSLINKFGGDGYLCYYGSLEMIAKYYEKYNKGMVTLPLFYLRQRFRKQNKQLFKIYDFLQERGMLKYCVSGDYITLYCKDFDRWKESGWQNFRQTAEYREWREWILQICDYRCQYCGSTENLHVHHIKPASQYPALALDKDNGTVYCEFCHRRLHSEMRCSHEVG